MSGIEVNESMFQTVSSCGGDEYRISDFDLRVSEPHSTWITRPA
jgi:hypothetical protein